MRDSVGDIEMLQRRQVKRDMEGEEDNEKHASVKSEMPSAAAAALPESAYVTLGPCSIADSPAIGQADHDVPSHRMESWTLLQSRS